MVCENIFTATPRPKGWKWCIESENESCCYGFQDFLVENIFGLEFDNVSLAEGHREAAMCMKWWLKKFNLKS